MIMLIDYDYVNYTLCGYQLLTASSGLVQPTSRFTCGSSQQVYPQDLKK